MPDLSELFPGFEARFFATAAGRIFARIGGSGPPLVLLHGFPQSLQMWHAVAPALARRHRVVAIDLRGYGWSSAPASGDGTLYAKREMAADVVAVMEVLGAARFTLVGHDRGARVGYRLALDQPGRIMQLALLDIVPTFEVWRAIEAGTGTAPHWPDLAKPAPEPETLIGRDPDRYFEGLMRRWTRGGTLAGFDPRAMAHYRAAWGDPRRIHAFCEDYRAGAGLDRAADERDVAAGKVIDCPVFVISSQDYLVAGNTEPPLDLWRRSFAPAARGVTLPCGHFVAEEAPAAVLAALDDVL